MAKRAGMDNALLRMVEAGRASIGVDPPPQRGVAIGFARAAMDGLNLRLEARDARQSAASLADLPEMIPDMALLTLVEAEDESLGFLALSCEFVAAVIEMQTTGRLSRSAPRPRAPTRTDAAMTTEFIDAALAQCAAELDGTAMGDWAAGYRCASWVGDSRPLGLLLEDVGYTVWRIDCALGADGGRVGVAVWAAPEIRPPRSRRALPGAPRATASPTAIPPAEDAPEAEARWQAGWRNAVLGANAALDVFLPAAEITLGDLRALAVGRDIPLPPDALSQICIMSYGRKIATGQLGQLRGARAVRITNCSDDATPETADAFDAAPPGGASIAAALSSARLSPDDGGVGEAALLDPNLRSATAQDEGPG